MKMGRIKAVDIVMSDSDIKSAPKLVTVESLAKARKLKVINLYGAPSSGKSTLAAYVFAKMKAAGYDIELVTEYAKELILDDNLSALNNQPLLLGNQFNRVRRLEGKFEWCISDSPIRLNQVYGEKYHTLDWHYTVCGLDDSFKNYDFILPTIHESKSNGRVHSYEDSMKILEKIWEIIPAKHKVLESDDLEGNYATILEYISRE